MTKKAKQKRLPVYIAIALALLALAVMLLLARFRPGKPLSPVETLPPETVAPSDVQEEPAPTPEAPVLNAHAAYLFPDEANFLRPDDSLGEEALSRALELLLPAEPESAEALRTALTDGAGALSRREFARRVAELSGWTAEERLIPAEDALAPVDLDPSDPDFALLLEASVPHRADEQGAVWTETALSTGYEPGVFLRGTDLYCCGENGFLLRDCRLVPLYFGADGRFSSGDAELDGYVDECLAALLEQFPEDADDRLAMLRHCNDYVRETFSYLGRRHIAEAGVDWSAEEAKLIFSTGKGSCYNYAAAFRALARRLGFPASTILRSLDAEGNIHAWTEIVIGGVPYVFDPQLESRYGNDRFMLSYREAAQYGYSRPDVAEMLDQPLYRDMSSRQTPEQQGEVLTAQGEDGREFLLYLPYGYDPDGAYNVLLCLGSDPHSVLDEDSSFSYPNAVFGRDVNTKFFLDFLIQEHCCDPLIVVAADADADVSSLIRYTVEHCATYASDASEHALDAARGHFALTCSAGLSLRDVPDLFSCCALFEGSFPEEETLAALRERAPIRFLLVAEGEQSEQRAEAEASYAACAGLDSVWNSCLLLLPRTDNTRMVFDAGLRHLLFYFSPYTGE